MLDLVNRRRRVVAAVVALALVAGCAGLDDFASKLPKVDDASAREPAERREEVLRDFDKHRNYAQFTAAEGAWRRGDLESCRRALASILERDSQHRDALLLTAELDAEAGEVEQAARHLRSAAAAHPDDEEVRRRLAALEGTDPTPAANDTADRDRDESPTSATATSAAPPHSESMKPVVDRGTAAVEAAAKSWSEGNRNEALRALREILRDEPKHVEANILRAEIELADGETSAARQRLELLVVQNPLNAQVRRACGLMYEAIGEQPHGAVCLARATELERVEHIRLATATEPAEVRRSDSSTSGRAPRPMPSAPVATADVPAALPAEEFAAADPPAPAEGLPVEPASPRQAFITALESGSVERAAAAFDQMVRAPGSTSESAAEGAAQALKFGQPETAERCAVAALRKFPRSAALHRVRGTALYQSGRDAEAESALKRSLSLDNTQGLSYFLLGSVQTRLGKQSEAAWQFRQAGRFDRRFAVRR